MAFIQTVQLNYDKLQNKETVNILWKEIIKDEICESHLDQIIEYSFHYPVDTEAYLEELLLQFDALNKENLRTIDGHLKACIYFIKDNTLTNPAKMFFLKLLKTYCIQEYLEPYLLRGTVNTFVASLMFSCPEMHENIKTVGHLPMCCMNSLREIIVSEEEGDRLKCILESLFKGLRKCVAGTIPDRKAAVNITILFIRDVIHDDINDNNFPYLLEAFATLWGYDDFDYYEDAVKIMNLFKVQFYKEIIRKMVLLTQSKNYKRYLTNISQLLYELAKNPPPYDLRKIEVLYYCAIRNVMYQFVNKDRDIADTAVLLFKRLCLLQDNPLLTSIFNQFECTGKFINISAEALLLSLIRIVDEKWGASPRNQNLLIIFSKFLSYTRNINIDLVQNSLKGICYDASPSALKPSLIILHEVFCIMAVKGEVPVGKQC
ncbi:hypothetical protein NQ317_009972 [Molorchus minor]|uniref:Uncharacterized protein n=1 Tax=Molorchus minor TaxID=1323400 RepID=A0ABQ9K709_9CUCU|nr:hypothetical protein NQ317_009972 [Molorchus minor]